MRGDAEIASVFPNTTDKSGSREKVYAEFLKRHLPSMCNVDFGGFVFGSDGTKSNQLDILVTANTAPRYLLNIDNEIRKTFSQLEGTLEVISVKSKLDKK
ncbi:MAG: hypothetical protein QNK92_03730 [Amylibacter sp.]